MNDEMKFKAMLDSLRSPTIAALVSFAEDESNILVLFEFPFMFDALERRGILKWNLDEWHKAFEVGMQASVQQIVFTEFGKAFVEWLRKPKDVSGNIPLWEYPETPDLPKQLSLFDTAESEPNE